MKQQEDGLPRDSTFLFPHLVKNDKHTFSCLLRFCSQKLPLHGSVFVIEEARAWIIQNLLQKDGLFTLSEDDMNIICKLTEGKLIIRTQKHCRIVGNLWSCDLKRPKTTTQ